MSEEPKRKTEWSFSFEKIGESIANALESVGISGDAEVKFASFSEAVDGAQSAKVALNMSIGEASVRPLTASDNLIEADVTYVGEIKMDVSTDGTRKNIKLYQPVKGQMVLQPLKDFLSGLKGEDREKLRWDVRLSPDVPLDLTINTGVTSNTLDLGALQVSQLAVNVGTGHTILNAPTGKYPLKVGAGTGELQLVVPDGADIDLDVNNGTGRVAIMFHEGAASSAKIAGGVGACEISVPGNAAVHVEATTGIGSIEMPRHFVQIKSGGEFIGTSGVWESPDYAAAANKITIKYNGGIGKLSVTSGVPIV